MGLRLIDATSGRHWLPTTHDWPVIIHGQPKHGASMFSVVLTAELIRRGERVVFMCAHGEAIRVLQTELAIKKPDKKFQAMNEESVEFLESCQLVTFFQKPGFYLLQALRSLTDWGQRIVVVKDAEEFLTPPLWEVLRTHKQLVVSGNFDGISGTILPDFSGATILFSPAPSHWLISRTDQPRYVGEYIHGKSRRLLIIDELGGNSR